MSTFFRDRSFVWRGALLVSLPAAGIACKGTSANGATASDTIECPPPPAANEDGGIAIAPYEGFANGSARGTGLAAALCNAEILLSDFNGSSSGLVLTVDSTAPYASTSLTLPAGALAGTLTASIGVGTPAVGVYTSSDAQACGSIAFSYGTVDGGAAICAEASGAACPAQCTTSYFCADAAAAPCCVPLATTYVYQAAAAAGCNGAASQTALGSWKLSLTSVIEYQDDASAEYGQNFYLAHGALTATLQGTTDTTDTATLTLTF